MSRTKSPYTYDLDPCRTFVFMLIQSAIQDQDWDFLLSPEGERWIELCGIEVDLWRKKRSRLIGSKPVPEKIYITRIGTVTQRSFL